MLTRSLSVATRRAFRPSAAARSIGTRVRPLVWQQKQASALSRPVPGGGSGGPRSFSTTVRSSKTSARKEGGRGSGGGGSDGSGGGGGSSEGGGAGAGEWWDISGLRREAQNRWGGGGGGGGGSSAGARRRGGMVSRATLLAALGGFVAWRSFKIVPAGHVGVVDLFGVVSDDDAPRHAGLTLKNPLSKIHLFSVKTQKLDLRCHVPSQDGLAVDLTVTLQYRLDPEHAVQLYKTVGRNYEEVIVLPQLRSEVRNQTSQFETKALYTSQRETVRAQLLASLQESLLKRGVIVEDVLLRSIDLPRKLTAAIEEKLQMEQESQRMEYVLQKERMEAERKEIEAEGIAKFQTIVSTGIDDNLLQWKGIEATMELARSDNAKVVVVGAQKNGLPIILGK